MIILFFIQVAVMRCYFAVCWSGGMEHAAASQVRNSWLHLLVRGVVQVSNFLLLSALAQTSWGAINCDRWWVMCRLKVGPEKNIMNISKLRLGEILDFDS